MRSSKDRRPRAEDGQGRNRRAGWSAWARRRALTRRPALESLESRQLLAVGVHLNVDVIHRSPTSTAPITAPTPVSTPTSMPTSTSTPSPSPTSTPTTTQTSTPSPTSIATASIGQRPIVLLSVGKGLKAENKGHFTTLVFHFSQALNISAAANPASFEVAAFAKKRVKGTDEGALRPITGLTVDDSPSTNSVTIGFETRRAFADGGQVTISPAVTGSPGEPEVFAISRGGRSITAE